MHPSDHGPHPGLGYHGGREQATEARSRLSGRPATPIAARVSVTLSKPKSLPGPSPIPAYSYFCCDRLLLSALSSLRYVLCLAIVLNSQRVVTKSLALSSLRVSRWHMPRKQVWLSTLAD